MTIYVDIKSCVGNFQIHFSQARSALFRGTGLSCRFDKKTLRCCSFSTAVVFAEVIRKELLVKSHMVDVKSLSVGFSVGSEPDLDVADFFRFLWILCCGCCEVTCTAKFRHSTRAKTQWLSKTCWFVRCLFKTSCSLVCVKGPKIENRWRKHWCTIYNTYVRNVKIWDPCLCFFSKISWVPGVKMLLQQEFWYLHIFFSHFNQGLFSWWRRWLGDFLPSYRPSPGVWVSAHSFHVFLIYWLLWESLEKRSFCWIKNFNIMNLLEKWESWGTWRKHCSIHSSFVILFFLWSMFKLAGPSLDDVAYRETLGIQDPAK